MRLVSNFSKGTLASSILSTDTSIPLTTGNGASFPTVAAPDDMVCILDDGTNREAVLVTTHGAGSDSFTVTRAYEKMANSGPTALAFAGGTKFECRPTDLTRQWFMPGMGMMGQRIGATIDRYYSTPGLSSDLVSGAASVGGLYAMPFYCTRDATIDKLGLSIITGAGAGGVAKMACYSDDGNLYPAKLLDQTVEFTTTSSGVARINTVSVPVRAGQLVWLVTQYGVAAPAIRFQSSRANILPLLGWSNALGNPGNFAWSSAMAYGAFPDPFPTGATESSSAPAHYARMV